MNTEEDRVEGLQKHTYASLCAIEVIVEDAIYREEHRCSNQKIRKENNNQILDIITDLKNIHHTDELMYYDRYKILDENNKN